MLGIEHLRRGRQVNARPAVIETRAPTPEEARLYVVRTEVNEMRSGIILDDDKKLEQALTYPWRKLASTSATHIGKLSAIIMQDEETKGLKIEEYNNGFILTAPMLGGVSEEKLAQTLDAERGLLRTNVEVFFERARGDRFAVNFDEVLDKVTTTNPDLITIIPITGSDIALHMEKTPWKPFVVGVDGRASLTLKLGEELGMQSHGKHESSRGILFGDFRFQGQPSLVFEVTDAARKEGGNSKYPTYDPVYDARTRTDMMNLTAKVAQAFPQST